MEYTEAIDLLEATEYLNLDRCDHELSYDERQLRSLRDKAKTIKYSMAPRPIPLVTRVRRLGSTAFPPPGPFRENTSRLTS